MSESFERKVKTPQTTQSFDLTLLLAKLHAYMTGATRKGRKAKHGQILRQNTGIGGLGSLLEKLKLLEAQRVYYVELDKEASYCVQTSKETGLLYTAEKE